MIATAENGSALVSWAPPFDGNSPITSYTVSTIGNAIPPVIVTAPAASVPPPTSVIVTGLANGTAYQFEVTATNAIGTGSPSTPTFQVTPEIQQATPNNTGATAIPLGTVSCVNSNTGGSINHVNSTGANNPGTHAWYSVTFNQNVIGPCALTISVGGSSDKITVHQGSDTGPVIFANGISFSTATGGTYFIDVSGDVTGQQFNLAAFTN